MMQMPVRMRGAALLLGVALLAAARPVHAQRIGLVAGITLSKLNGIDDVKVKNRTGTMFGISLLLPGPGRFSLQPELLFVSKGAKVAPGQLGSQEIKLDYLEIPLLLRANLLSDSPITPHLYFGPSAGFNLNCSVDIETSGVPEAASDCKRDNFKPKTLDWGAVVGAGVDLTAGTVGLTGGVRYGVGLRGVVDEGATQFTDRVKNGTFAVYAGLKFGF